MNALATPVLVLATITMGLAAGLFYTFACGVMIGLRRVDDRTFVSAMQWINATIVNGWFAISFFGALVLTAAATVLHLGDGGAVLAWTVAGLVCYGLTFAITVVANVPLNNALNAAGPPDQIADLAAVRGRFENPWIRWNILRAVLSTAAFASLTMAVLRHAAG